MPSKTPTRKSSGLNQAETTTRVLLALWSLGAAEIGINKGEVTEKIIRKGQKTKVYQSIYQALEERGAIQLIGRSPQKVMLTPDGVQFLIESLQQSDFRFDDGKTVGAWVANALIDLMSYKNTSVSPPNPSYTNGRETASPAGSYQK